MATKAKAKPQTSAPPTYTCAMDKLRDEMAKSKQRYVQVVGEYLTDYLQQHPEAEDKLMAAGKSIEGSLGAMKDEARKHEQGGVGILDDATAFGVVLNYFGITAGETQNTPKAFPSGEGGSQAATPPSARRMRYATEPEAADDAKAEPSSTPAPDPFDLDALMGGL